MYIIVTVFSQLPRTYTFTWMTSPRDLSERGICHQMAGVDYKYPWLGVIWEKTDCNAELWLRVFSNLCQKNARYIHVTCNGWVVSALGGLIFLVYLAKIGCPLSTSLQLGWILLLENFNLEWTSIPSRRSSFFKVTRSFGNLLLSGYLSPLIPWSD